MDIRRCRAIPRKRFAEGQKSLSDPEVVAMTEFKEELPIFSEEVVCPFCAFKGRVIQFRTKKSERSASYSTKMFGCPDCHERMRRNTLLKDMTVSEWARFLYLDVIMYGGYHRINFPKLLERLREYGWATEFWSAWKAIKEHRETSDVEDYLDYKRIYEREQRERLLTAVKLADETRQECDNFRRGLAGTDSMFCTICPKYNVCWGYLLEEGKVA